MIGLIIVENIIIVNLIYHVITQNKVIKDVEKTIKKEFILFWLFFSLNLIIFFRDDMYGFFLNIDIHFLMF